MSSRARAVRSYPCKGRLLASKSALMPLEKRPKIDPKWPRPARSSAPWLVVACTLAGNRLATRSGHDGAVYAQFSAPRAILGARGGVRDPLERARRSPPRLRRSQAAWASLSKAPAASATPSATLAAPVAVCRRSRSPSASGTRSSATTSRPTKRCAFECRPPSTGCARWCVPRLYT